jgi:hypothetical protein
MHKPAKLGVHIVDLLVQLITETVKHCDEQSYDISAI